MKTVTGIDDFLSYCRKRRGYICLVYGLAFAVFGIWTMQDFVSFDAEGFYTEQYGISWYQQWLILGRWFFVALKKLLGVTLINPFFSIGIFLICFPLSCILWGYLFACWVRPDGRASAEKKPLRGQIVFDILYLTHPVWAYQFAYRNQMEVISLVMVLLPVSVLLTACWIRQNRILCGILGFLGVVCCFGSYQAFVIVYISALMIYLFLQVLTDQADHKSFWIQVVKISLFSVLAYLCYSKLSGLICSAAGLSRNGYDQYLLSQIRWGVDPLEENLKKCGEYFQMILLGDSNTYSCIYGSELIVGLLLLAGYTVRKMKLWKRIWLFLLFAGIFLSSQLIDVVTVGNAVIRQEFAYVLTLAFIGAVEWNVLFRLLNRMVPRAAAQSVCGVLLLCVFLGQMQTTTRLLYSDYRCATTDYERLSKLYYDALENGAAPGSAIAFIGYRLDSVEETVVDREVIGFTYFEVLSIAPDKAGRAMRAYGFDVKDATSEQLEYAESIKDQLAVYPSRDSIRIEDGLIIVRMS